MDGNHKLIRWKFVVHGAIDGYSRVIVMLKCSTNNKAETVLHHFTQAGSSFGLPDKLRTDGGGENVDAWQYMIQHRNSDSVIVGSSVHNERIERLWRDVRRAVLDPFRDMFARLEDEGSLDTDNDTDLFCLHKVFTSRINKRLEEFTISWNNHPLSTERNMTPFQLFCEGQLQAEDCHSSESDNECEVSNTVPVAGDQVQVPNLLFQPCNALLLQINVQLQLNQQRTGDCVYREIATLIGHHLLTDCSNCLQ